MATQTMDDQGHVVTAAVRDRDWRTKQMKAPVKVTFHYDTKGRLVEQDTDAPESERSKDENEVPPGKVSVAFDDDKHTKTSSYSSDEGVVSLTVTYNDQGAAIGLVGRAKGLTLLDTVIDCDRDSHGNWAECRQLVTAAGVTTVEKIWRRTILYR